MSLSDLDVNPYRPVPFYGDTVVEISVPSGRLIVSDDLRSVDFFNTKPEGSINYGVNLDAWGKAQAVAANLAYAFVGNSCPDITRQLSGELLVVTRAWDEEKDEAAIEDGEVVVASICTDHWAVMMTDYQNWLDNGGPDVKVANEPYAIEAFQLIDVTPGLYRFTVYSHSDRFSLDDFGRTVYAKLELVS